MAVITKPYTFTAGSTIVAAEHNSNFDTVYDEVNGNLENANIKANAAIAGSKITPTFTANTEVQGNLAVTGAVTVTSNVSITSAGAVYKIKTGANASMGTALLQGGTAEVSNTTVTTMSHIFLSNMTIGGTAGALYISNVTDGALFKINSSIATDSSKVAYLIMEPV